MFAELRAILNLVWEADRPQGGVSVVTMLRHRFFSFGMVLTVGFQLIVSLTISAVLAAVGNYFIQWLPVSPEVLDAINFLVSFAVTTGAFALLYECVPIVRITWNDVWIGASRSFGRAFSEETLLRRSCSEWGLCDWRAVASKTRRLRRRDTRRTGSCHSTDRQAPIQRRAAVRVLESEARAVRV